VNTREATILVMNAPDASMQRWLCQALARRQLLFAKGEDQALKIVSQREIALAVLYLTGGEHPADLAQEITQLRCHTALPVIALFPNGDAWYAARVLDAGVDDYVRFPVGFAELDARCHALLRRAALQRPRAQVEDIYPSLLQSRDDFLRVYVDQRQVFAGARGIRLTKTEFELLQQMMRYAGKVLTHRWLLERVWGPQYDEQSNYLRVYIRQLRSKVEPDPARPRYIQTRAGIGYGFQLI